MYVHITQNLKYPPPHHQKKPKFKIPPPHQKKTIKTKIETKDTITNATKYHGNGIV